MLREMAFVREAWKSELQGSQRNFLPEYTHFFKSWRYEEDWEKSRQSYQVKQKPAVVLLPFLCRLINRTSLLFFTTHLDEIPMKHGRDCYCLSPEKIDQCVQKLLRRNGHPGKRSDHIRLVSFNAQANSKPVMYAWIDGPAEPPTGLGWATTCVVDAKKSNKATASQGSHLKVSFTKSVGRHRKVRHSAADWGS